MTIIKTIETERTFLRQLSTDDASDFYKLNLDEDVLKYTGDKPFANEQAAFDFIQNYDQYKKYGVGRLAVIDKANYDFLGWCGLKYNEDIKEYDLGFRFFKKHWNHGLATETAIKCLDYGLNELSLKKIIARVRVENIASIRVLEKSGMTFKEPFLFDGSEGLIYEKHKL